MAPPSHRIKRGRAVAALVQMGWRPPPLTHAQAQRLLDDMARIHPTATLDLTEKEIQHLRLASKGLTEDQMAELLGLARETVKYRAKTIRRKLGARSTTHAVAIALREGAIE